MIDNYAVIAALFWFLIISLVAMVITIADKAASKKTNKRRVPEKRLFFISFIGGSPAMLATMLLIRHKTLHKRFAIGIPLMFITHVIALYFLRDYLV